MSRDLNGAAGPDACWWAVRDAVWEALAHTGPDPYAERARCAVVAANAAEELYAWALAQPGPLDARPRVAWALEELGPALEELGTAEPSPVLLAAGLRRVADRVEGEARSLASARPGRPDVGHVAG